MDRRKRKTQQAIKDACTVLMEKNSFEQINISDITTEADISRGTFYLHFEDKYDMIHQFEQQLTDRIQMIFTSNIEHALEPSEILKSRYSTIVEIFTCLQEEEQSLRIVLKYNGGVNIQEALASLSVQLFELLHTKVAIENDVALSIRFFAPVLGSLIISVFQQWNKTEEEIQPEQLAKVILNLLLNGPAKVMGIIPGELIDVNDYLKIGENKEAGHTE